MNALETLLEVQDHDTKIDQLRHRREALPEKAALADVEKRAAALEAQRAVIAVTRDAIASQEEKAEQEIAASEKRVGEIDTRMRSGAVTASRELQAMQGEIDHIRQRISTLEDTALEAMEEREPLDSEIEGLDQQLSELSTKADELRSQIEASEQEIDSDLAEQIAVREGVAGSLPSNLTAAYEKLRARLGGVGAARLDGNRCSGCHLELPAVEVDRLRHEPPDTLEHCDQCGRILVRTA